MEVIKKPKVIWKCTECKLETDNEIVMADHKVRTWHRFKKEEQGV